jgi:hypothetical protein
MDVRIVAFSKSAQNETQKESPDNFIWLTERILFTAREKMENFVFMAWVV